LKLAVLVSVVLALAKLGFLDFITGGFDTGRFGGLPILQALIEYIVNPTFNVNIILLTIIPHCFS
jgi:hypothetical protein